MRRIAHGLPAKHGVPRKSELGILRKQLGLVRPSMPIRQLLAGLPETFGKLAPCVLMSPLSVAQYLPADQATFDVVIFDEASQITTWDAIGAIARGCQTIIVGDPKQLPPTNFFGRADDDDEDLRKSSATCLPFSTRFQSRASHIVVSIGTIEAVMRPSSPFPTTSTTKAAL